MLYLKCDDCGEVFDAAEPQLAYDHSHDPMYNARFEVVTEEEAF